MAHEALIGPAPREPFEDIHIGNPNLLPALGNAAYFPPRSPRPFDSVTVPPVLSRLHPFLEERGVRVDVLATSDKDKLTLLTEIAAGGINIGPYVRSMVENPAFTSSPDEREILHAVPQIKDLGIKKPYPTTSERDARAMELDLEAQTGKDFLQWALEHANGIKPGEVVFSSMKSVTASGGDPSVLYVGRRDGGVWLNALWVHPSHQWDPGDQVAFRLRQSPEPLNT